MSYQETFEVIDQDKVQSSDNDIGPAEPVSASLVEIVEETRPNQVQNNDFKQTLQTKNSLHSSAIFTFPRHKVHSTLQTDRRKTHVKLKQKSARVYTSSSKSKIFTRVSIPGKHRIFNTSHAGTNWTKVLLSPKFTSLKHNTFKESALQLSHDINVTDEAKKRINQMERNQAASRDILEAFISRMDLNLSPHLQPEPSPHVDVPESLSHPRPSKTVLLNKGNTNLPPKKASLQRTLNQRGGYQNFYTARKPSSLSRNSLQPPAVIKGVPLEKNEKTSPPEPEVFDNSPNKILLNSRKNSTSNSGKNYVKNSPNLRILNSLLRDKDAHFLDNIVTELDKSGLGTHPKSQISPLSPSVNKTEAKGKAQQQEKNKSQEKSRNIVIGRDKSGLSTHPNSQVSSLSPNVNNTQTKGTVSQLKKNRSQDKNGNIITGRDESRLETRPSSQLQVLPISASVNETKTKATKLRQMKKKTQGKSKNIVTGLDKSGLGTRSKGKISLLSPSVHNTETKGTPQEHKNNKSQEKSRNIVTGRDKSGFSTRPQSQVSPISTSVKSIKTSTTTTQLMNNKTQDKSRNIVTGREQSGIGTRPTNKVSSLSPSANNIKTNTTTTQLMNNKTQDNSRNIVTGREQSGLVTRPTNKVSSLSPSANNIKTNTTTTQLINNKTQDNSRNIVTEREQSRLVTRPTSKISSSTRPSANNTKTSTTTQLMNNKTQDKNGSNVTGREKSGVGTSPIMSKISSLSPSANATKTTTTVQLMNNKTQDKNGNNVTGHEQSGVGTSPIMSKISSLSPSANATKTTTTVQLMNNKTQDKNGNNVTGHEQSGVGTSPIMSKISSLSPSANATKTTTTVQLMNNKTQDKNGNNVTGHEQSGVGTSPSTSKISSLSPSANNKIANITTTQLMNNKTHNKTNEKPLVNHNKSGSYNLVLAHARENATHLNSTKLSIKTTSTFFSSLDSNISLKHFSDLLNFFNSFNFSSDKKPTSNISSEGNSHVSNKFKNGTRNRIVSENLLKFLDFVHTKKTSGNFTSKRLDLGKGHAHSDNNSIADQIKKQLQMSIYRGWNKASKGRRLGSKKLPTSLHPSVKNKHTNDLHDTTRLKGNDTFVKSKGDNFELNVLQMMKNVSQKELLKLEGDIVKALSSAKQWNLQQNPGHQHQISPEKTKDEQLIHRQHNKQEHLSEKQLNYEQLNKQGQMLRHSNPKFGQQQNQTQKKRKSKQIKQQIEESNNGTKLQQHELKFEYKQSHLQQTNHTNHQSNNTNMSRHDSLESTSTVQNCSLLVSVNTTKKSPNYGCNQTHNKLSHKNNGRKDLFSHFSNTSQVKTGALIKIAHTLHNVSSLQSPLAHHSSARKITGNNTLPLRTGDDTFVTIPGFNVAKDVDDTKNILVQLDRDSAQEKVNTESISEGTAGSGIVELTEFVDQGKLREKTADKGSLKCRLGNDFDLESCRQKNDKYRLEF